MELIQQGKTNWMFIVIVLAVAVSGGAVVLAYIQDTTQQSEAPLELNFFQRKLSAQNTLTGAVIGGNQTPATLIPQ
jgi:hypothetical protein